MYSTCSDWALTVNIRGLEENRLTSRWVNIYLVIEVISSSVELTCM